VAYQTSDNLKCLKFDDANICLAMQNYLRAFKIPIQWCKNDPSTCNVSLVIINNIKGNLYDHVFKPVLHGRENGQGFW